MKTIILFFCLAIASFTVTAQPGTLDITFGNNGTKVYEFNKNVEKSIQLKDGRILILNVKHLLAVLPSGDVDISFGENGFLNLDSYFGGYCLAQDADGKIVIGGLYLGLTAITRYNLDGSIDRTFGKDGTTNTYIPGDPLNVADITIQPDGKIAAAALYEDYFFGPQHPLVLRYNSDGSIDKSFGDKGGYFINHDVYGFSVSVAVQEDGKIVTAGFADYNIGTGFAVLRYTAEGLPDSTFDKDGVKVAAIGESGDTGSDLVIQPDGKIIVVGSNEDENFNSFMAAMRFNEDGSFDETFANNGTYTTSIRSVANAVVLQQNGKILVAGSGVTGSTASDYMMIRLLPDGSYDKSFNDSGIVLTDIKGYDEAKAVMIATDGKIILAGNSNGYSPDYFNFSLARYLGDPINLITKATIKRWIKNHILNWQATVSNNDISYYAIERSQSGTAGFTQIAKVKANKVQPNAATATYAYNLASNAAANSTTTNYYRIRAVNTDGSFVYSDVVSDAGLQTGSDFTVSPNPARDVLKVSGLPANRKTVVNIVNRNGNVLQTVTAQSSAISINVSALHSGVYYVQLFVAEKTEWLTFIKE